MTMDDNKTFERVIGLGTKMRGLGISWFRKEDWPRWLEIDSQFQPDYQHWLRRNEAAFAKYQAAGVPIIKVLVDPDEFLAWSKLTGKGVDTVARSAFVSMKVMATDAK